MSGNQGRPNRGPVYMVKPKYIFKHPFNKYDLSNPTNRETQNEELTDYFNYGFNEDTMNIYGKLVKRFIEVIDHDKHLRYFNEPSELMRLNDEIPMDFGGFNKFHDPWLVDNQTPENFHTGENLIKYFIMNIFYNASSKKVQYPLIQFVAGMYKKKEEEKEDISNILFDIIEQICKNLESKYQTTMNILTHKTQENKHPTNRPDMGHRADSKRHGQRDREEEVRHHESKKEKRNEKESRHHSSDDSDSDSDDDTPDSRRRRDRRDKSEKKRKDKKHSRDDSRDRRRKDKKDKHKSSKKVKKEKSHRRSRSHDKKKKHH